MIVHFEEIERHAHCFELHADGNENLVGIKSSCFGHPVTLIIPMSEKYMELIDHYSDVVDRNMKRA